MKKVLAVILTFVLGGAVVTGAGACIKSAHAEEQLLNLWPTQRSLHDREMDISAKKYHDRGQDYVDQLYSSHGEKYLPESEGIHDDLDLPPMIETEPVNVDEVADMIKDMNSVQATGPQAGNSVTSPPATANSVVDEKPKKQQKTPMAAAAKRLQEKREKAEQLQMMQAEGAKAAE